jgi:hypothetical protein
VPDDVSPPATDADADRFETHWWPTYPARNGKKLGKAKTLARWRKLSLDDQRAALRGARHYAAACEQGLTIAKDPERWLRDRCWLDWQEPATPDQRGGSPPSEPRGFAGIRAALGGDPP